MLVLQGVHLLPGIPSKMYRCHNFVYVKQNSRKSFVLLTHLPLSALPLWRHTSLPHLCEMLHSMGTSLLLLRPMLSSPCTWEGLLIDPERIFSLSATFGPARLAEDLLS